MAVEQLDMDVSVNTEDCPFNSEDEQDEDNDVPNKFVRIYVFSQIEEDNDNGLRTFGDMFPKGHPSWKKVDWAMERVHPGYQDFAKARLKEIHKYREENKIQKLLHMNHFIYIPSKELLHKMLIMLAYTT